MNSNETEARGMVWNLIIGIRIACYITLSTWIFALHQKLSLLSDTRAQSKVGQATHASSPDELSAQARYQVKENELRQQLEINPAQSCPPKKIVSLQFPKNLGY